MFQGIAMFQGNYVLSCNNVNLYLLASLANCNPGRLPPIMLIIYVGIM
jgi:hypothetical protein